MKKELFALLLLAGLIIASAVNVRYMDSMTKALAETVSDSRRMAQSGNFKSASARLTDSLELWLSYDTYAHIFLRHPELDSTTDAYYQLLDALNNESTSCEALYSALLHRIEDLSRTEHLSPGTIL